MEKLFAFLHYTMYSIHVSDSSEMATRVTGKFTSGNQFSLVFYFVKQITVIENFHLTSCLNYISLPTTIAITLLSI